MAPTITQVAQISGAVPNDIIYQNSAYAPGAATANIDIPLPETLNPGSLYIISIENTSPSNNFTVVVQNKETFGTAKYPELTRFIVPASIAKSVLVQGWFIGEAGRLALSSDYGNITASIRVRKA